MLVNPLSLRMLVAWLAVSGTISAATAPDDRNHLLDAMRTELDRNMATLALPGSPKPYFIAYRYNRIEAINLSSKYGSLQKREVDKPFHAPYIEVRVGDRHIDNTPMDSSGIGGYDSDWTYGPLDANPDAVRTAFWIGTDTVYKMAIQWLTSKQSELAQRLEDADRPDDFTEETAHQHFDPPAAVEMSVDQWTDIINKASARFKAYPWIHDSSVDVWGKRDTMLLVSSEGSRIARELRYYWLSVDCTAYNPKGEKETHRAYQFVREPGELLTPKQIDALVDQTAAELKQLLVAEQQAPYTGPAILFPEATGVMFHEALGHRLEADRLRVETDGHTFKGKAGEKILPNFISVYDDPTTRGADGRLLAGSYNFDDEGIPAQPVTLVDRGVLKNFLLARTPIKGFTRSNGHGRADPWRQPMARMANLVVSSSRGIPYEQLKKRLIEECRQRGKPYGLIIKSMHGGETNTSTWKYQAFRQEPRLIYRVNLDSGQETLMRGVSVVGTPLLAIQGILECSDTTGTLNAYCGSVSGHIPVSASGPAILCSEVEFQRESYTKSRPPILDPPFGKREKLSAKDAATSIATASKEDTTTTQ